MTYNPKLRTIFFRWSCSPNPTLGAFTHLILFLTKNLSTSEASISLLFIWESRELYHNRPH